MNKKGRKRIEEIRKFKEEQCDKFVRARNPYELRYFVIGRHDDKVQQYKQLLVELDAKYKALEEADFNLSEKDLEREELELDLIKNPKDRKEQIHNEKIQLKIDKIELDRKNAHLAMLGALKECDNFLSIADTEYKEFAGKTEDELLIYEREYWKKRFARQIEVDKISTGNISAGNLKTLLQMPKEDQKQILVESNHNIEAFRLTAQESDKQFALENSESKPRLQAIEAKPDYLTLKLIKDAPEWYPKDRIVKMDITEIMIGTLHRPDDKRWISEQFYIPTGKNYIKHWIECPNGDSIGEYKNRLVMDAISLGCTHIFIVDDDMLIDNSALQKLYEHDLDIVGGMYPKKTPVIECASMIKDGKSKKPVPLNSKGLVEIDWSLAAGCILIKTDVFKKLEYPWFKTTNKHTEDTYMSQKAIKAGYKVWLDCDVRCGHVDKDKNIVYTCEGKTKELKIIN